MAEAGTLPGAHHDELPAGRGRWVFADSDTNLGSFARVFDTPRSQEVEGQPTRQCAQRLARWPVPFETAIPDRSVPMRLAELVLLPYGVPAPQGHLRPAA